MKGEEKDKLTENAEAGKERPAEEERPIKAEYKAEAVRTEAGTAEDEFEARRRKRNEERRKKREKQLRMMAAVSAGLVLVLVISVVSLINLLSKRGSSANNSGASANNKQSTTDVTVAGQDGEDGGSAEADGTGDAEATAATEVTAESVISQAATLAAMYDYDNAIAMLQGLPQEQQTDSVKQSISDYTAQRDACVAVDVTQVAHVFFHSLINDDRAFKADLVGSERVRQNNAAMTTTAEFDAMFEDMYEAGYVLVGLDDLCVKTTDDNGVVHIAQNTNLRLPEGKIPFILSIDDLSYYHSYGIGTQGYATRMLVDENGKPKCEYTNENGETSIGDYDVVPRTDTFIEKHPDFCYRGARGTVAMTGYNGVFGYRTNTYYNSDPDNKLDPDQKQWLADHPDFNFEEDCAKAKEVADAMKAEGWTFASHTYGHLNAESSSLERLMGDHERWKTCNEPILGKTDKIIFAFGADIGHVGEYTDYNQKFQYFKGQGFNIFCNVDGNIGWTEFGDTFMRTGRVALDGFTMYQAMTDGAAVHSIYARDYEKLGIRNVSSFFNQYRPTPIESE